MKIKSEHILFIKNAVNDFNTPKAVKYYQGEGLSHKRYRWDLLYKAGLSKWLCDNVYKYAHDDHIDTALRKLALKYA